MNDYETTVDTICGGGSGKVTHINPRSPTITNAQYQQLFEASKPTASRDLSDLTTKKLVSKVGTTGKGTSYVLIERKGLTKGSK